MSALSLDEIEQLLNEARIAADLFARVPYRLLARDTHPDRHPGDPRAVVLFRRVQELHDRQHSPRPVVRSTKRTYTLDHLLAAGDVADIYLADADSAPAPDARYVAKVSRVPDGDQLLGQERAALTALLTSAGDATYRKYLPTLAESFPVRDGFLRRVNVFLYEPDLYTLEQVHARHPALDGRHLGWVFKRLLTVLGFVHRQGFVHGAIVPVHVLLHPAGHGLKLVGWGHSGETGQSLTTIPTRFGSWYPPEVPRKQPATPATDIFLAARCMVYLAGGDPVTGSLPDAVPVPLTRFFRACLLDGPRMRPDDAWGLLDEFDDVLAQLYGPPKFHELVM